MFPHLRVLALILAAAHVACPDRRVITTLKYSRYRITPTIINGTAAHGGQLPYVVSIKDRKPDTFVWFNLCGGTIISPDQVVTAAHCFETADFFYQRHPDMLRVVAGNLANIVPEPRSIKDDRYGQWRTIKSVRIPSNFVFPANDIAVAFLTEGFTFNSRVNSIPAATTGIDYPMECFSAGYGSTGLKDTEAVAEVLLIGKIDVFPRYKCSLVWQMNMNNFVCSSSVLSDVSMGDSGGPLVCHGTNDPAEVLGQGVLVGVVSGKNFDMTSLYTRVSEYQDIIQSEKLVSNFSCGLRVSVFVRLLLLLFILLM